MRERFDTNDIFNKLQLMIFASLSHGHVIDPGHPENHISISWESKVPPPQEIAGPNSRP